jgi:hypothetical protein
MKNSRKTMPKSPMNWQAPQGQLESDEEQQEDDAEIADELDLPLAGDGEPVDHAGSLGQTAQPVRSEQRTDRQVAQNRAHLEAPHDRRDDGRGAQNDQGILEGKDLG